MPDASTTETEIFEIIQQAGEARTHLYEALEAARRGDAGAESEAFTLADEGLTAAHRVQAELVRRDLTDSVHISLLLVHAQDQLMTTMKEQSLIRELVALEHEVAELRQAK